MGNLGEACRKSGVPTRLNFPEFLVPARGSRAFARILSKKTYREHIDELTKNFACIARFIEKSKRERGDKMAKQLKVGAEDGCCEKESFFSIASYFGDEGKVFSIIGSFPSCGEQAFSTLDGFMHLLHDRDEEPGPFVLVFNCLGGALHAMYTFFDTLGTLRSPIYMVAHCASSAAAILFIAAGTRRKRFVYPNASIVLHNPSTTAFPDGQNLHDLQDSVVPRWCEIIDEHCNVNSILARRSTVQWPPSEDTTERRRALARLLDLDQFFTAQEAIEFGLADKIVTPKIAREFFAPKVVEVPKRSRRRSPPREDIKSLIPSIETE